ncbi:hypothetical protein [Brevibacillus laterosporus]|uniref:hypothetical protein n=1 Tax=Brevibacillus laterosporus TaxID=1465 RepID=UPI00268D0B39|nr:hypothetical protein [Brevibacillus laterosporus]MED1720870.1 hypothetical protein [Brevibacillus laterosporus]
MNKTQMEHTLNKLRWINYETIKAQNADDQKQEALLGINLNGRCLYSCCIRSHRVL